MWTPSSLSKNPTATAAPAGKGEAPYYKNAMMTSSFEGGVATKMHSFEWGATKMPLLRGAKNNNQPTMEDEGDDANAERVCNNEAFEAAPLSGANA
jgi:hypothetical protein